MIIKDTRLIGGITKLIAALWEGTKDNELCYVYNHVDRFMVSVSPVSENQCAKGEEIEDLLKEIEHCRKDKVIYHVYREDISEWCERKMIEQFAHSLVRGQWKDLRNWKEKEIYGTVIRDLVRVIKGSRNTVVEIQHELLKRAIEIQKDYKDWQSVWSKIGSCIFWIRQIESSRQEINKGRLVKEIEKAYKEQKRAE